MPEFFKSCFFNQQDESYDYMCSLFLKQYYICCMSEKSKIPFFFFLLLCSPIIVNTEDFCDVRGREVSPTSKCVILQWIPPQASLSVIQFWHYLCGNVNLRDQGLNSSNCLHFRRSYKSSETAKQLAANWSSHDQGPPHHIHCFCLSNLLKLLTELKKLNIYHCITEDILKDMNKQEIQWCIVSLKRSKA